MCLRRCLRWLLVVIAVIFVVVYLVFIYIVDYSPYVYGVRHADEIVAGGMQLMDLVPEGAPRTDPIVRRTSSRVFGKDGRRRHFGLAR